MANELIGSLQKKGDEFYLLMGNCISIWADIEEHLFKICWAALGGNFKRAAIVYGRTPTIESRRLLIDDLLATILPPKDRQNGGHDHADTDEWKQISSRLNELLKIRNRIAHQPMGPRMHLEEAEHGRLLATGEYWFEISTSEHEEARKGEKPTPLTKPDLETHINDVWALKDRLAHFRLATLQKYAGSRP